MGKMFWSMFTGAAVVVGLITVKYFKIDAVEARQSSFEQRTEERMMKYDERLIEAISSAKVSEGLLKQIREDTKEIRQSMLDKK